MRAQWRTRQLIGRALQLADEPSVVRNLPGIAKTCAERLQEALTGLPAAFRIDLGENAVDCIFSMHVRQQIGEPQRRLALLKKFNRVTRTLGVDSSLAPSQHNGYRHNRTQIEKEFVPAGFSITGHRDFIPGLAMRRLYVLRKNA